MLVVCCHHLYEERSNVNSCCIDNVFLSMSQGVLRAFGFGFVSGGVVRRGVRLLFSN